jgi:hypothetical protein
VAYINLVYTNNDIATDSEEPKRVHQLRNEHLMLVKLDILRDKFCDKAAKHAAIEAIRAVMDDKTSEL